MEAFEQFVALAMEAEGLVVSGAIKFPVRRQTRKKEYAEFQTHGFEVDLIGARSDRLVLASVKSFFGSRGVVADHVSGAVKLRPNLYAMLNDEAVRTAVLTGAVERFGYDKSKIEFRLYVGKFAGAGNEEKTREWCDSQKVGSGPIREVGAAEVVEVVRNVAVNKQYRDNAVLAALKVLDSVGVLV